MDFDNPSYFSMPNGQKQMGHTNSLSSASDSSLTRQLPPSSGKCSYRDKRFFLRSVSSNSADSNQELLIMGEPRISDIAPDLIAKNPANRSNSLKNQRQRSADMHCDLSYIPLPTSEEEANDLSEDEVFVADDTARYYNFTALKRNAQRRHSIGTFVRRERSSSVASSSKNFKEDFPQKENDNMDIDEHSLRHASYPRKRCPRCTKGSEMTRDQDVTRHQIIWWRTDQFVVLLLLSNDYRY